MACSRWSVVNGWLGVPVLDASVGWKDGAYRGGGAAAGLVRRGVYGPVRFFFRRGLVGGDNGGSFMVEVVLRRYVSRASCESKLYC
jgi:hypothetical protein